MEAVDRKTLLAVMKSGRKFPPRETQLPASKQAYPKLLCLDTKDWIALGQAHHQRSHGQRFQRTLDAVREGIRNGRLVVPLLSTPVFEAVGSTDPERRERFVRFIVELSDNKSMLPHTSLQAAELRNAVRRLFQGATEVEELRETVVHWGVSGAFGQTELSIPVSGNSRIDQRCRAALLSPEASVRTILSARGNGTYASLRTSESETMQAVASVRAHDAALDPGTRERIECGNWIKSVVLVLADALLRLRIEHREFMSWLGQDENLQRLCRGIPSTDILLTLMFARDRDPNAATDSNDGLDWRYLQTTIPHANIVLTENKWAHHANQTGLSERYGVRIMADLTQLPEVLAEEGCV
ncbi:hypothetical protein HUW62_04575 [Myxococcus sp. AM011]|uniref:hypothetical protein n=1 Tax=Myxococcus sp. AM011 TaxID=2745200 RepID=UPI001595A222|nr:hypothetical protein [Myxococcus sp. AM011]NVJ20497.1 hypothetical protein [Myxococcus sp. AM011]